MSELTPSEIEILRLTTTGKTIKGIARQLQISPYTVMTHRVNIMAKIGVSSMLLAVVKAHQARVINLDHTPTNP